MFFGPLVENIMSKSKNSKWRFKKNEKIKQKKRNQQLATFTSLVLGYAERENNFVILISESQSAIPKIPVYQISQQLPKHFRFTLTSPPFSIFHFKFHNSDTRFAISNPENPHIPSFGAIAKKLRICTTIAAILDPPFRILQF